MSPLDGPALPQPKPEKRSPAKRASTTREREAREAFKQIVCAEDCIAEGLGDCEYPLQAAHVVSQQTLRDRDLAHLLWDPIGGVPLCYRHHRRHDNGTERLPQHLLPARCLAWCERYGLMDLLDRFWPAETFGGQA